MSEPAGRRVSPVTRFLVLLSLVVAAALLVRALVEDRRATDRARRLCGEARSLHTEGRVEAALALASEALGADPGNGDARELREDLLIEARATAENAASAWRRLADERRLDELLEDEARLGPSLPGRLPILEGFLRRAEELVARGEDHARALARIDASGDAGGDAAERWRRGVLLRLVSGLRALHARLPSLRRRVEVAGRVVEESVASPGAQAAWAAAAGAPAHRSFYAGLRLQPVPGLLPRPVEGTDGLLEFALGGAGPEGLEVVFRLVPGGIAGAAECGASESRVVAGLATPPPASAAPPRLTVVPPFFVACDPLTAPAWRRLAAAWAGVEGAAGADAGLAAVLGAFGLTPAGEAELAMARRAGAIAGGSGDAYVIRTVDP